VKFSFLRVPDQARAQEKMLYQGTKMTLIHALAGISAKVNGTELDEITEDIIIAECRRFS
jgi:hypothetical protein